MKQLFKLLAVFVACTLLLASCHTMKLTSDVSVELNNSLYYCDNNDYIFSIANGKAEMLDKKTQARSNLIKSPFDTYEEENKVIGITADEKNIYYAVNGDGNGFQIMAIDAATFDEKEIYSENFQADQKQLFGNVLSPKRNFNSGSHLLTFLVIGQQIILLKTDGIYLTRFGSSRITTIYAGTVTSYLSYTHGNLFFISPENNIICYDMKNNTMKSITDHKTIQIFIKNGKLYYINLSDAGQLYSYDIETGQTARLTQTGVTTFTVDDQHIYYADRTQMSHLYQENLDGSDAKCIFPSPVYSVDLFEGYDKLFIMTDSSSPGQYVDFQEIRKAS